MKRFLLSVLCLGAVVAPRASAYVATFTTTNQAITMTGLGADGAGRGQDRTTWGTCVFAGGVSTCTVTATFTGFGGGGTISWVLTYQGNGPSPLTTGSVNPGGDPLTVFSLSAGSFVTTITESDGTVLNFYGQAPFVQYITGSQCSSGITPCATGKVGLTVGGTITGPMSGSFDTTPVIRSQQGVISAGSYGAFSSIAPATWIEIYGSNLATNLGKQWGGSDFNGVNAPTALSGTTVTVAGQVAFVDFVSPTQVNVQVPSGVPVGLQPVVVTTGGGISLPYPVQVNAVQPGLLAPSVFQINGQQYIVALFPDGVTYVLPPGVTNAVPTKRAKPGDTIVLFGIGFGPVTPTIPAGQITEQTNALASVKVSIGGAPATVNFAGLVGGFVGLYQFNVVVPSISPNDTAPLIFSDGTVGGSQSLVVAIGN